MRTRHLMIASAALALVTASGYAQTPPAPVAAPAPAAATAPAFEGVFRIGAVGNDDSGNLSRSASTEPLENAAKVGTEFWGDRNGFRYDVNAYYGGTEPRPELPGGLRHQAPRQGARRLPEVHPPARPRPADDLHGRLVGPRRDVRDQLDQHRSHGAVQHGRRPVHVGRRGDHADEGPGEVLPEPQPADPRRIAPGDDAVPLLVVPHLLVHAADGRTHEGDRSRERWCRRAAASIEYSYEDSTFSDGATDLLHQYNNAIHPANLTDIFLNRVQYDDAAGLLPIATVPGIEQEHAQAAGQPRPAGRRQRVGPVLAVHAAQRRAPTSRSTSRAFSGRIFVPIRKRFSFKADVKRYDIKADDVFVDMIELVAPAGLTAGHTYAQAYPTFGDPDYVRHSELSRTPTEFNDGVRHAAGEEDVPPGRLPVAPGRARPLRRREDHHEHLST